jgi:hypothetical protein
MKDAVLTILLLFTIATALMGLAEIVRGEPGAGVFATGAGFLFTLAAIVNIV